MDECPNCGGETEEVDRLVGTVFAEKYEIQSVLGSGGMSVVYKARHKYMNRIVAVKLLLEHLNEDKTSFARFQKEAEAASTLSHHNIVSVHDFGVEKTSGQAYFVMDCLEGESLQDLIFRENGVPLERAVDIFRQVCEGLAHAHKKGVIHRDLKPSNVVLVKEEDGSETVKIVDFGLAKLNRTEGVDEARLTQSGMVFGSPLYMSPEQCQGFPLDARSDIYAMGVLMFETLTGLLPFKAESFFNIALLHVHQKPPAFAEIAQTKQLPEELEKVVMKCLEKEADNRFQTVDELRQKILDSALLGGVPGLKAGAVVDADSERRKSPFRSTFENMRAALVPPPDEVKKTSIPRAVILSMVAVFIIAGTLIFFMFPGVEGDHATPYQKMRWALDMEIASLCIQRGDYGRADQLLKDARDLSQTFGDRHGKLRLTIERQAELYAAWGKFDLAERANQDMSNVLTEQVMAEAEDAKAAFRNLGQDNSGPAQLNSDRSHAIADVGRLITAAKRVHSRNLFKQEESLLFTGKDALERLGLGDSPQMADVDLVLADCLVAQQRMPEVRDILVDAADALQKTAASQLGNAQTRKKYIRAELRLGQFDRDQSNYAAADKELADALAQTKKYAASDRTLLAECLNSYADLLRQTGKTDESAALVIEAKALNE